LPSILTYGNHGKNPYRDTMEPLEIGGCEDHGTLIEEFQMEEPVCYVSANYGMPNLRVKPKSVSMHGTQFVQDPRGGTTYFSISKQSRIQSISTKHNKGDRERELMYSTVGDKKFGVFGFASRKKIQVCPLF
jgi:hypothetical protein